jgi:hypothetical protein
MQMEHANEQASGQASGLLPSLLACSILLAASATANSDELPALLAFARVLYHQPSKGDIPEVMSRLPALI